jgi:hypothetical protein
VECSLPFCHRNRRQIAPLDLLTIATELVGGVKQKARQVGTSCRPSESNVVTWVFLPEEMREAVMTVKLPMVEE